MLVRLRKGTRKRSLSVRVPDLVGSIIRGVSKRLERRVAPVGGGGPVVPPATPHALAPLLAAGVTVVITEWTTVTVTVSTGRALL